MLNDRECLQCGATHKETMKGGATTCGLFGDGDTPEVEDYWGNHRWADWTNPELTRAGIRPDAFERYRRTNVYALGNPPCVDLATGHIYRPRGAKKSIPDLDHCYNCEAPKPASASPNPVAADNATTPGTPEPTKNGQPSMDLPKRTTRTVTRHEWAIGSEDEPFMDSRTLEDGILFAKREMEAMGIDLRLDNAYKVRAEDGQIILYVEIENRKYEKNAGSDRVTMAASPE